MPLYHFVVVVDDEAMEITDVIRGEDHLSNTPKHIALIRALGYREPRFGHIPMILNADRSKMSKRKSQMAISAYREEGYLPEALVNFLAFLGWSPGTEEEIFTLDELAAPLRHRPRSTRAAPSSTRIGSTTSTASTSAP